MIKCPNCGSTAQLKVIDMGIVEDPCGTIRFKTYECGCGYAFTTRTYYKQSSNEMIADSDA